jgi:hypothetical protein
MDIGRTSDVWWKNAIFYCLDVETFQDGNGDGIGDFVGLTQQIDYLSGLGVTCLWLMPFYPSPHRDDGYDITDYYAVDQQLGSLGDFVEFVRTARDRGIRVIADLVVNHTSKEHPWFRSARANRNSPYRDWYVWRDEVPEDGPDGLVFPGEEDSNWEWDEDAGQYYLHRFYKHQPDLNIANSKVREEIRKIVGFWLEMGLCGFRVDAAPFLLETDGVAHPMEIAPHDWLRDLRGFLGRRRGDAMLMGEVNLGYEDVRRFFGNEGGQELHMCLNFNLNQALALVRQDSGPQPAGDAVAGGRRCVGELRPQPRRVVARQADRSRTAGGVPGLRPQGGDAAFRTRTAPPDSDHAGQRSGADAPGLQSRFRAPRGARPVLRRGDRHGREPVDPRPDERARADAMVEREKWRLLDGTAREAAPAGG